MSGSNRLKTITETIDKDSLIIDSIDKLYYLSSILSSKTRVKILYYIYRFGEISLIDLSREINIPLPIVSKHISKLEKAGLVISGIRPGRRGLTKVVRRRYNSILIDI